MRAIFWILFAALVAWIIYQACKVKLTFAELRQMVKGRQYRRMLVSIKPEVWQTHRWSVQGDDVARRLQNFWN